MYIQRDMTPTNWAGSQNMREMVWSNYYDYSKIVEGSNTPKTT